MFKKYSIGRDGLIATVVTLCLTIIFYFFKINILVWSSQTIVGNLIGLYGVLFGFILTIITVLFMFDPIDNQIFNKLKKDGIYNQIFARFFDSLIVVFVSLVYFILISLYSFSGFMVIFKINLQIIEIINFISASLLIWTFVRVYRCLKLLSLIYHSLGFK